MGDKMLFRIFIVIVFAMFIFAVGYGERRNMLNKEKKNFIAEICDIENSCEKLEFDTDSANLYELFNDDNDLQASLYYDKEIGVYKLEKLKDISKDKDTFWKIERLGDDGYEILEVVSLKDILIFNDDEYKFSLV